MLAVLSVLVVIEVGYVSRYKFSLFVTFEPLWQRVAGDDRIVTFALAILAQSNLETKPMGSWYR
jgi:hypothetical protein